MRRPRWRRVLASLLLGVLGAKDAIAGGLSLYEVGTADVGLAAAGYSARAQDASTVLTNPAGMTRLDGHQLTGGLQALYGLVEFSPGAGTSPFLGGGDGGNAIGWFPGGSLFYSHSITQDLKVGIGLYGNFGLAARWDDNWVGRYYGQKEVLLGMSIQPTVAYRISEHLSVGAGLIAMQGFFKNKVAINNRPFGILPDVPDGELKLNDRAWGFGANAGVMVEFTPQTRLGVTYTSPIDLDFSAQANFSGLGPGLSTLLQRRGLFSAIIDVGITVPQGVMASLYHELTDRWAVLGSFGWQQWSKFGAVEVGIESTNPTSLTTNLNFKDTFHGALGAQFRPTPRWLLNAGVAYDSSLQNTDNVSPIFPVGSAWRFGLGGQYAVTKSLDLGLAFEYLYGGNIGVNRQSLVRGNVVGNYDAVSDFFLAANLNWRF